MSDDGCMHFDGLRAGDDIVMRFNIKDHAVYLIRSGATDVFKVVTRASAKAPWFVEACVWALEPAVHMFDDLCRKMQDDLVMSQNYVGT